MNTAIHKLIRIARRQDYVHVGVVHAVLIISYAVLLWAFVGSEHALTAFFSLLLVFLGLWLAFSVASHEKGSSFLWRSLQEKILQAQKEELEDLRLIGSIVTILPQPVLLVSHARRITSANRAALSVFGASALQGSLSSITDDRRFEDALRQCDESEEHVPFAFEYRDTSGVIRYFSVYVIAVRHTLTPHKFFVVVLADKTDEKRLEKTRADFVANASHELRTPLTSLLGFIETLQEDGACSDNKAQKKFLKIMHKQALRMRRLLSDLMALSQIEHKAHRVPGDKVDLHACINEVIDASLGLMKKKKTEIIYENLVPSRPIIAGDRSEIVQMIQNIVDNAAKYGRVHEPVRLFLREGIASPPLSWRTSAKGERQSATGHGEDAPAVLSLVVINEGEGVDANNLPRLTERFYRVDAEESRARGGTGLGLAIVKHIVTRHLGTLTLASATGEGFYVACCFPRNTEDEAPAAMPERARESASG